MTKPAPAEWPTRLLVVLLLGLGVFLAAGWSVASADELSNKSSVQLAPGDNSFTWDGDPRSIQSLFDAYPAIALIYAWDRDLAKWRLAARRVPASLWTLTTVRTGEALFVKVSGASPVRIVWQGDSSSPPDVRYIGWIGQRTSTASLFRSAPEIQSIQVWDTASAKWRVSTRGNVSNVSSVHPGMGLKLQLKPGASFSWKRPMQPVRGLVELQVGDNLVAWAGSDNTPISEVARGIGQAFREARLWNDAEQRFDRYSAEGLRTTNTQATIDRGDALWVTVSRNLHWLQPAGLMPRVVFAGAVSQEVRTMMRQEMRDAIDYYYDTFGVEADGSLYTVYVAADVNSLVRTIGGDAEDQRDIRFSWLCSTGWFNHQDRYVVLKSEYWDDVVTNGPVVGRLDSAREVLTHEFFHVLQDQLQDDLHGEIVPPLWLVEGTATWASKERNIKLDDAADRGYLHYPRSAVQRGDAPPLRLIEFDWYGKDDTNAADGSWAYQVGSLAAHELSERANEAAHIEFWRGMTSQPAGPQGRWESASWERSFADAFGLDVEDFYAQFDHPATQERAEGTDSYSVTGIVVGPDGQPLPQVTILVYAYPDGARYPSGYRVQTDGRGRFGVPDSIPRDMLLAVEFGSCLAYYRSDGMTPWFFEAERVDASSRKRELRLALEDDSCVWQVSGQIVQEGNLPAGNAFVAIKDDIQEWESAIAADGTFSITVPANGSYALLFSIDRCELFYRADGRIGFDSNATVLKIRDADRTGIRFVIPKGACEHQVQGILVDHAGQPLQFRTVMAIGSTSHVAVGTGDTGRFRLRVPVAGAYTLRAWNGSCEADYGDVYVHGVVEIEFKIPQGSCVAD